jgi:DNA-binding response OmpR family regulator
MHHFRCSQEKKMLQVRRQTPFPHKLQEIEILSVKPAMNLLIIDDEPAILEKLQKLMTSEHYTVTTALDGHAGLEKIWNDSYDLILLDIMLPGINGLEILKEIRAAGISTPVLMLTAKGDIDDKVAGLNLGADDYLAKPFSIAELLARVRALIRRGNTGTPVIEISNIRFNTVSREVTKSGELLTLTSKEFAILEFLLHNRGRVISRFTLAEHVWGDDFDPFSMSNFINVHISNLRKKLKSPDREQFIKSIRGIGYLVERDLK